MISLNWTESAGLSFSEYVLQTSNDGSSWATFANILDKTNTSIYISGLIPGATKWWQVIVYDPLSQYSNTLKTTQPSTASLSLIQQTGTSIELKWNNNAVYGGFISFDSYELMESVSGGAFGSLVKIIDASLVAYTVGGLAPSTIYSFYLNTTDGCKGCSAVSLATTESNTIDISTPGPLSVVASARPDSIDAGQLVYFSCSSAGGMAPYSYSWTFGDGSTGTGSNPTHLYGSTGTMIAVCNATDSLGAVKNSDRVAIAVYTDPSILSFTATPNDPYLGQSTTFVVSTSGGNGSLTYSYANLPKGCLSTNATAISCAPTSTGNFEVTVTVTDRGGESATAVTTVSVGEQRIFGLPQAMGLAVIFGSAVGIVAVVAIAVVLATRRKKNAPIDSR
jgi:PKD domain-containing protein